MDASIRNNSTSDLVCVDDSALRNSASFDSSPDMGGPSKQTSTEGNINNVNSIQIAIPATKIIPTLFLASTPAPPVP